MPLFFRVSFFFGSNKKKKPKHAFHLTLLHFQENSLILYPHFKKLTLILFLDFNFLTFPPSLRRFSVEPKLLNLAGKDLVEAEWDYVVDTLLETFQTACTSSNARVIENSLEALLTLVEKNMIVGSSRSSKIGDILAKSYEVKDDSVHMTILLTFGMLVAKPQCELHDAALMAAIRVSYNLFLITANTSIQKMAKEKLTEIFRTLFQRMHSASSLANDSSSGSSSNGDAGASSSLPPASRSVVHSVDSRPSTPIRGSTPSIHSRTGSSRDIVVSPATPKPTKTENVDEDSASESNASVSESSTSNQSSNDAHDQGTSNTSSNADEESSAKDVGTNSFETENSAATSSSPQRSSHTPSPSIGSKMQEEVAFKDALQAFRGLCKLSVKAMPETQATNIQSFDIRSRILCLELLNNIFEEDNLPTFRDNTRFVNFAIKKQLMDTIYVNISSPISLIFRLTLSLCVALVKEFRESLKAEVEAILSCIFLPILESPNATAQHRLSIIRALYVIYKSPQCLADIFVNYDCEVNGKNIFENLTKTVARAAQRKTPDNLPSEIADQENLTKHMAVKTSVCVAIALVDWSKGLYEHPSDRKSRRDELLKSGGASKSSLQGQEALSKHVEKEDWMLRKELKTAMDEGKDLFKLSFKKGVRFFWEHGMCEKNEVATGRFLFNTPGLDKTMLGEFLGERYDFDGFSAQAAMAEYASMFNYTGMEIDLALRLYLGTFRLPGEGQKVERIMEKFSAKYFRDTLETGHFGDSDAVYYLSMAITMLTTSIHNPSVQPQDKLTLQSWKKLLLGQNAGKDYDDTMVDGVFARIAAEEFKVRGEDAPSASSSSGASGAGSSGAGNSSLSSASVSPSAPLNEKQKAALFYQEAKYFSDKAKECVKERNQLAQNYLREMRHSASAPSALNPTSSQSQSSSSATSDHDGTNLNASANAGVGDQNVSANKNSDETNTLVLSADSNPINSSAGASGSTFVPISAPTSHPLSFIRAFSPQIADYMIRSTGLSLLSTYMTSFESSVDHKVVQMCLEGIRGGIRLACLFQLELERDAFVNALAQLTLLEIVPSKELKPKHIEAISALLTVTDEEGDLGETWKRILACISPLEKLLSSPPSSSSQSSASNRSNASGPQSSSGSGGSLEDHPPTIDELNASFVSSKIRAISIDRIFTNSSRLSDDAIVDFVSALCQVSKSELLAPALANQTRTFSLQKLGEVADFNIARPKTVWMTMWTSVAAHFTEAGLHRAPHVALVAVDSLRQVASKLLERHTSDSNDASGTTFQVSLLSPFEAMYANPNDDIRDYLICCLAKLMATHFKSVHSGWPAILAVIEKSSFDKPTLVELGIHQLEAIKMGYFDSLVDSGHFAAYVDCISKFCGNVQISEKIASQAIALLKFCALRLSNGSLPLPSLLLALEKEVPPADVEVEETQKTSKTQKSEDSSAQALSDASKVIFTCRPAHRGLWFPILRGLIATLEKHDINTRPIALNALFEILNLYGDLYSRKLFKSIFLEIIFPVFEEVLKPTTTQLVIDDSEWLLTTCHKFLHGSVVLFGNFFSKIGEELLPAFLDLLTRTTLQNNEKLATFGITCIETLLTSTTALYDSEMWSNVIDALANIMRENMPQKLRVANPNISSSSEPSSAPSDPQTGSSTNVSTQTSSANASGAKQTSSSSVSVGGSIPHLTKLRAGPSGSSSSLLNRNASVNMRTSAGGSAMTVPNVSAASQPVSRNDPRKKILLGKAWIQNSALRMIRECLVDGTVQNEKINAQEPKFVAKILDIYMDSFLYAYKVLRDPKLEHAMEQALYDLILKQEIDSMWTYTEVVFGLFTTPKDSTNNIAKESSSKRSEIAEIAHERILSTFSILEQCHTVMAQQSHILSDRSRRLHESNEALVIAFLSNIQNFSDDVFLTFLSAIFPSFLRLTLSDSVKVRETVRDVMGRLGLLKLGISKDALSLTHTAAVDIVDPETEESVNPPTISPKQSPRKLKSGDGNSDANEQTVSSASAAPSAAVSASSQSKEASSNESAPSTAVSSTPQTPNSEISKSVEISAPAAQVETKETEKDATHQDKENGAESEQDAIDDKAPSEEKAEKISESPSDAEETETASESVDNDSSVKPIDDIADASLNDQSSEEQTEHLETSKEEKVEEAVGEQDTTVDVEQQ